jgi:hypothetical protein
MIPAVPVRPQRPSPLTQWGIPEGYYYCERTGLLKQAPTSRHQLPTSNNHG